MNENSIVLYEGRFLRLIDRLGWEYVERRRAAGVVVLVALTRQGEMLFIEQMRASIGRPVIELPAGLVGDSDGAAGESLLVAARRELEEETGFTAETLDVLMEGPSSPGITNEVITFVLATGLDRVGPGGGSGDEDIRVYPVALAEADRWLAERQAAGLAVDPRVYAGVHFALRHIGGIA